MKSKSFVGVVLFLGASCAFSENLEALIKQSQKGSVLEFPASNAKQFSTVQKAAQAGDGVAQKKVSYLPISHIKEVYRPLIKSGGLLFSVRRPVKGYSEAVNNYAVNIENFFAETTDQIKIGKHDFSVTSTNGTVLQIRFPEYRPADKSVSVIKDGKNTWIPLADLIDPDRQFVESAFADEMFKSSGEFSISSVDSRSAEATAGERDKVSQVDKEYGEKVEGSFVATSTKGISRKIILENEGRFPLANLMVEYQSFAKQTVMGMPQDFPADYRCAGFFVVKSLNPGEKKELVLNLPETVEAKQQTIDTGSVEYYRVIPSDCNQKSEGRMGGIWVKVHRFTPYGERLTREYKSAGVPDLDWANVAPVGVDIRR